MYLTVAWLCIMIGVVYVVIRRCKNRRSAQTTSQSTVELNRTAKRPTRQLTSDETRALGIALLTPLDIQPPAAIHTEDIPWTRKTSRTTERQTKRAQRVHVDRCVVCLEEFGVGEEVRRLACRHYFHVPCIDPWLGKRAATCPLCNYDVAAAFDRDKPSEEADISRV